ncbi:hypothetical protein [Klebsiella quasipneumoniae]|uniref:hypothetical protein n=1 Tax=Klebsiella quasipneumoniae TaxID=1463165 RepID=UPI00273E5D8D|nr:hypothetical protein [Klebsiella quasipneumoniae]
MKKPMTKLSVISAVSKVLTRTALTTAARITPMSDITELARERLKEKFDAWFEREYKHLESSKYTDAVPHIKYGFWTAYQAGGAELVEAVEKAQGMETYWKTQCRGITDHCEVLQARIAELESRTVKLPAERFCPAEYAGSQLWSETEVWNKAITACADALRADGIKVEAE